jgi:hypothetical protein
MFPQVYRMVIELEVKHARAPFTDHLSNIRRRGRSNPLGVQHLTHQANPLARDNPLAGSDKHFSKFRVFRHDATMVPDQNKKRPVPVGILSRGRKCASLDDLTSFDGDDRTSRRRQQIHSAMMAIAAPFPE